MKSLESDHFGVRQIVAPLDKVAGNPHIYKDSASKVGPQDQCNADVRGRLFGAITHLGVKRMDTGSFIGLAFPALIKATNDSLAPNKLQSAYGAASAVGRMMAKQADREKVMRLAKEIAEAIDSITGKGNGGPEYLMVVASLFCDALENYTVETTRQAGEK
jgi:hypothetical protein